MNDGIRKFRELLLTNGEFQQKLKTAAEAYTGEQTEEAVFQEVLVPLAAEYGISVAYEDFHAYLNSDPEMDRDELAQVAGGTKGLGANACWVVGIGLGGSSSDHVPNLCIGVGAGTTTACAGEGVDTGLGL